jgi:hypothetical protein
VRYRLRRHPISVSAHFRHSLVLAYALPASVLEPLLPPTLEPDRHGDLGFAAAAFVQTERMRPSFLPPALGLNVFLGGYRIFVRVVGRPSLRGLYIIRSDTDRRLLTFFGNALTSYRYRTVDARCRCENGVLEIQVRPGVEISADTRSPAPLPPSSPFASLTEARRFAGPLPYTFHHEAETGLLLSVRGVRSSWSPEPVSVEIRELAFFTAERFGVEPALANAFYVGGIDYKWERGKLLPAAES